VNVLVDTNILLDFLLQREPFFHDAERLFQAIDSGQIVGYAVMHLNWVLVASKMQSLRHGFA